MISRLVFLDGSEPTRRRVRREAFDPADQYVLDAFVEARLLTTRPEDGGVVVDVAHEALFRHWAPLRQDVGARADHLRRRSQVERWALNWDRNGRERSYLLRDERLRAVMRWVDEQPDLWSDSPLSHEFLETSRGSDNAWLDRLSDAVAQQARLTVDVDPELALLLAIAAVEDCAPRPAAFRALHATLDASRQRAVLTGHTGWVWDVAWAPDGQRLLSASMITPRGSGTRSGGGKRRCSEDTPTAWRRRHGLRTVNGSSPPPRTVRAHLACGRGRGTDRAARP